MEYEIKWQRLASRDQKNVAKIQKSALNILVALEQVTRGERAEMFKFLYLLLRVNGALTYCSFLSWPPALTLELVTSFCSILEKLNGLYLPYILRRGVWKHKVKIAMADSFSVSLPHVLDNLGWMQSDLSMGVVLSNVTIP